jgi:HlyD family secretion protein
MEPSPPILPGPRPKSWRRKWGWLSLILIVVAVAVIAAVMVFKKRAPAIAVQTEKVARRNLTEIVTANGKIQPVVQVTISPEVSGEIIALAVKEGQHVSKGDLLLKIKPDSYVAALTQAKASYKSSLSARDSAAANLEKSQADYKRNQELFNHGLLPESDFVGFKVGRDVAFAQLETATNQVETARASVDSAEDALSKTTLFSPIDGTVVQLNSQVGERVLGTVQNAGTEIMTIADLTQIEARVDIGEMDVVLVHPGQKAELEVDAFKDRKFSGTVTQIANSMRTTRQTPSYSQGQSQDATKFTVRVRLNEIEDFRPGMSVTANIETRYRTNALTVPLASVTTRPKMAAARSPAVVTNTSVATNSSLPTNAVASGRKSKEPVSRMSEVVFVINGNTVKQVPVKIGICDDNYWEITDGLSDGQEIVVGGYRAVSKDLADGKKIVKGG